MNYRPDLVDWKKVEKRHVRERIDQAFHIMEKEYGVTRLLDPEGKILFYTYESSFTAKTQLEKCELLAKKTDAKYKIFEAFFIPSIIWFKGCKLKVHDKLK